MEAAIELWIAVDNLLQVSHLKVASNVVSSEVSIISRINWYLDRSRPVLCVSVKRNVCQEIWHQEDSVNNTFTLTEVTIIPLCVWILSFLLQILCVQYVCQQVFRKHTDSIHSNSINKHIKVGALGYLTWQFNNCFSQSYMLLIFLLTSCVLI